MSETKVDYLNIETEDEATRSQASELVNEYFKGYMGSDVAYTDQLSDYVVHSVSGRKTPTQLLIEVNYSVKPTAYGSLWYSGNGSPSSDGWIHNKYGCTVVNKNGDTYTKVDSLGTGCNFTK